MAITPDSKSMDREVSTPRTDESPDRKPIEDRQLEWLADLGIDPALLLEYSTGSASNYQVRYVPRRGGGFRKVFKPADDLKTTQRLLLERVLGPLIRSPIAANLGGSDRGANWAVALHENQNWVGCLDIHRFFPSVSSRQVEAVLGDFGFARPVAKMLTGVVTREGSLPQGASTSDAIAHLLLAESDSQIFDTSQAKGVAVSRYSDDFTVSGRRRGDVKAVLELISAKLRSIGLKENRSKRVLVPRSERQLVLGRVVNFGSSIPRVLPPCQPRLSRRSIALEIELTARQELLAEHAPSLLGRIEYVRQTNPGTAARLERKLANLQDGQQKK